jgi:hypothetical protein
VATLAAAGVIGIRHSKADMLARDVDGKVVGERVMLSTFFLGGLSRRSTYQGKGGETNPARGQRKGGEG